MEADKTVSTEIEVSMLTTAFETQLVPMPICTYRILRGGPTGDPIRYALVGEQVQLSFSNFSLDGDYSSKFTLAYSGAAEAR